MKPTYFFLIPLLSLACLILPKDMAAQGSLNMTLAGQYDDNTLPLVAGGAYSDCWGYAANGREYAILGTMNGTLFIDITNPATPVVCAYEAGGAPGSIWRDYKTYGNYCYAVQDGGSTTNSRLQVFDLSGLPLSVTKVYESATILRKAHSIYVEQSSGRLYAAGANTLSSGIIVMDIQTNPASPTLLAMANLGRYSHDVHSRNDTLYCFMGNFGMQVWDFTDLANLNQLATLTTYPDKGYNHSGWVTDDHNTLVFADETHGMALKIADISNHSVINVQSIFRSTLLAPAYTNSITHNPFIDGNLCYTAYYHDGVQVFDISDPNNVVKVAWYDTEPGNTTYSGYEGVWGVYPYLPSGRVIASDLLHGLFIFDMNIALPVEYGDFAADWVGNRVRLNWETQSESNNSHFMVERSADGAVFEALGQVEGAGNTAHKQQYAFWDDQPLDGVAYYRLQQVDLNGESHTSQTLVVNRNDDFQLRVLYPNPVSAGHAMRLGLDLFDEGTMHLRIFDLVGKEVWHTHEKVTAGRQDFTLPTEQLERGTYLLKVQGARTQFERKFVVN